MNLSKAKEIIRNGVIPGDIDSVDLAEAKGFLEGWETATRECMEIIQNELWPSEAGIILSKIQSLLKSEEGKT